MLLKCIKCHIRIMPGGGAIIGGPLIGGWAGAPLVGAIAAGEGPPTPRTGPCKPNKVIIK
jgi:hypothetical protein